MIDDERFGPVPLEQLMMLVIRQGRNQSVQTSLYMRSGWFTTVTNVVKFDFCTRDRIFSFTTLVSYWVTRQVFCATQGFELLKDTV